jgi:cold shock CspA family protein
MPNNQQTEIVDEVAANRLRGYLRLVKEGRFAFIQTDDGADFFAHANQFKDPAQMKPGAVVEFTPIANTAPGKLDRAKDVVAI